jgi:alkanesulfonate monooxygenase
MKLHWYLIPTDGPFPWRPEGRRPVGLDYLQQLAGAIDHLGFEGALVACGGGGHDLWTLSSFLAARTQRMKFIIAQHPGQTSPLLMAQKAATFDQLSSGRLIINIVNGGDDVGPPHGVFLPHDERYEMADEYWSLWSKLVEGERVTHQGKYFRLEGAALQIRPHHRPGQRRPELHFGGSSPAAQRVAAKHVDTYLTYAVPPPEAALHIQKVSALASAQGRQLEYGVRLHVIVRETAKEAWVRRIRDYEARGFGTFILSGYPLIEEAYRFADLVMPLLREERRTPQLQSQSVAAGAS